MTGHVQVPTCRPGVQVDAALRELIEACWAAGLETQYSCQGTPGKAPAQIVFASVGEAVEFIRATMERSHWYNRLTLHFMEPYGFSGPARAAVEWPVRDKFIRAPGGSARNVTAELTKVWVGEPVADDHMNRHRGPVILAVERTGVA